MLTAGLDTRVHTPAEIGTHAGTLLPDPETQVVMASVRAEIAFALENRGLGAAAVARSVEETALALGIADLLDRPTAELSGESCNGSPSPARSPPARSWCCSTSPPRSWTRSWGTS